MKKIDVTILCDRCGTKMPHGVYNTEENVSIEYYDMDLSRFERVEYNMCSTCVRELEEMLAEFMKNKYHMEDNNEKDQEVPQNNDWG